MRSSFTSFALSLFLLKGGIAVNAEPLNVIEYQVLEWTPGQLISAQAGREDWVGLADTSLLGQVQEIRLSFREVDAPLEVWLQCASHFEGFRRQVGSLRPGVDEQWVSVQAPPEGWAYFGGENDGKLHGPIRVGQVMLKPTDGSTRGQAVLTRLTCLTEVDPSQAVVVTPVYEKDGQRSILKARLIHLSPQPVKGTLGVVARDENGIRIQGSETEVEIPGSGKPVILPVLPDTQGLVCLDLEMTFSSENRDIRSKTLHAGWASDLQLQGSSELIPASPWGMGLYLYRYSNDPSGLARMHKAVDMAQAAGVKWSREEIQWHRTEPEQGRLDFEFYDKLVTCAHEHGISVYGLLAYWSSWTQPYTEQGVEDYCRWAGEVVSHFKDRIHHWEIWNEPNIFFWDGPKELYFTLLKKAYETIKSVDPTAQVLGCSTSGIDLRFIQQCMEAGAPFDILTLHPYRGKLEDRRFIEELQKTRKIAQDREAWITEMGWPTHLEGVTELEQAQLLCRTYLCAAASGASPNVSWYDFRDDGDDPFYNEHHFGATRSDLTPKPAYHALATVCNTLGTVSSAEALEAPQGWLAYRFKSQDRPDTVVVWSGNTGGSLLLAGLSDSQTVSSFMGRSIEPAREKGITSLLVPPAAPVFLPGCGSITILGVPLRMDPLNQTIRPGEGARFDLTLSNPTDLKLKGQVVFELPEGWTASSVSLKAKAKEKVSEPATLTPPANIGEGIYPISCEFETSLGPLKTFATVTVLKATKKE